MHPSMTLMNFSSKEQLSLDTPSDSFTNLPEGSILPERQSMLSWISKITNFQKGCPQSTNRLCLTKRWAWQVAIMEAFLEMPFFKKNSNRLNCNHVLRKKETSGIDGVGGRSDHAEWGFLRYWTLIYGWSRQTSTTTAAAPEPSCGHLGSPALCGFCMPSPHLSQEPLCLLRDSSKPAFLEFPSTHPAIDLLSLPCRSELAAEC